MVSDKVLSLSKNKDKINTEGWRDRDSAGATGVDNQAYDLNSRWVAKNKVMDLNLLEEEGQEVIMMGVEDINFNELENNNMAKSSKDANVTQQTQMEMEEIQSKVCKQNLSKWKRRARDQGKSVAINLSNKGKCNIDNVVPEYNEVVMKK